MPKPIKHIMKKIGKITIGCSCRDFTFTAIDPRLRKDAHDDHVRESANIQPKAPASFDYWRRTAVV